MFYLLVLFAIALLIGVFTFLSIVGKIKIGGAVTVYTFLTLLPAILMAVLPMWVISIIALVVVDAVKKLQVLPYFIISSEILILTVFILIKFNVSATFSSDKSESTDRKLTILSGGKRLLQYSIYSNILYLTLAIVPITYFVIKYGESLKYIILNPLDSIGGVLIGIILMIFMPIMAIPFYFYAIVGYIIFSGFTIMAFIVFVVSANGTIRLFYASEHIRKNGIIYGFLVILPIFNIFSMLRLCQLAKMELKSEDFGSYKLKP